MLEPENKPIMTWDNQDESTLSEVIKQQIFQKETEPETEAEEL